jgi:hypothetical protein
MCRFPRSRGELHPDAVEFMARALKADPASVAAYDWSGRSIERHHGQIRRHFGFRVCGEAEGEKLAAPEPANLGRLKKAIAHRWGMLRLIDVLKEAVLRSGCLQVIERAAGQGGRLGTGELLERILLVIYAYGTGAGIRAVAAADRSADTAALMSMTCTTPAAGT